MKRWVMRITTWVSLVLCIGVCVLWGTSYWRSSSLQFSKIFEEEQPLKWEEFQAASGKGSIEFSILKNTYVTRHSTVNSGWITRGWRLTAHSPEHLRKGGPLPVIDWRREWIGFGIMHGQKPKVWVHDQNPKVWVQGESKRFRDIHVARAESFRAVWVPHWFFVLIFGVWPGRRVWVWRRLRRRRQLGQCLKCGYDLRGGGENYPECGAKVQAEACTTKCASTGEADRATMKEAAA